MKITTVLVFAAGLVLSACQLAQVEASGAYIGAEAATAALIQKTPSVVTPLGLLVLDWQRYQGGTLTSAQEATLLQAIVAATGKSLSPTEAALLDGATQQILANVNTTAPTPIGGAAAAIVTDVINGVARELVINGTPAPTS
jgi:hypothetical protein